MTLENVIENCTVHGNVVKLPDVVLDRQLYSQVAKKLEGIGGKWKGGKVAGFVFDYDPSNLLASIVGGEKVNLKKDYQFFETPEALAFRMCNLANITSEDTVLEPSAGKGAIIRVINVLVSECVPDCYELMEQNREALNKSELRFDLLGNDFLKNAGKKYTKIIANPPFSKNQDIEHLREMYNCLEEGGRLVCITSESWCKGGTKKQVGFRDWLGKVDAEIIVIDIERGTFKESGTMVGAKIVVIDKKGGKP
jgi:hypothetical protein